MTRPEASVQAKDLLSVLAGRLQRFSERTGAVISWLTLPMVVGTFLIALLRYAFALNWIWMQELVVWMHAFVFMLAAAYTLNRNEHVRVDIFYRQFSGRRKALVDLLGSLIFLLPMSIMLIVMSMDYVITSWAIGEGSREAGGLPFPFVPLLKTAIPLAFALVCLQGIAIVFDSWVVLVRGRQPAGRERTATVPPGEGV
jgi:TRAP-type mannitol/chloroaromatic compound transport system permease small subunit